MLCGEEREELDKDSQSVFSCKGSYLGNVKSKQPDSGPLALLAVVQADTKDMEGKRSLRVAHPDPQRKGRSLGLSLSLN